MSADSAIFCRASWTLFSPKSRCPASQAARTASMGWVLETATRRTSPGWRPARRAASAIRALISASRRGISLNTLLLELGDHGLRRRGVRPVRSDFQIGLKRGHRIGELAFVEQGHPHLVVRL